jgi:murein DD-endopeptidase MepM/ murein hydrolase activator NlpD
MLFVVLVATSPVTAGEPTKEPAIVAPSAPGGTISGSGYEHLRVSVAGTLDASFRKKVAGELAAPLTQVVARLLVWWVNVQQGVRPSDTVELLYERPPGKEPLIRALRYHSNKNEKGYRAYLFKAEGSRFSRYYDEAGTEIEERLTDSPLVEYEQVTSLLRDGRRHKGVDFKTPIGTAVKMPFDATLVRKNWSFRGNGNCLEFQDGAGRRILFLHLSPLKKALSPGAKVGKGEVVAETGNTGRSTAPHLHYQVEDSGGKVLDPFKLHKTYRASLAAADLSAFQLERARYESLLDEAKGSAAVRAPAAAHAGVSR